MKGDRASIHCSFSYMAAAAKAGKAEGRSSILDLPCDGRGPSTWAMFGCFPRFIGSELEQKQIIRESGTGGHTGHWHYKQQLNLICHSAGAGFHKLLPEAFISPCICIIANSSNAIISFVPFSL